MFTLQHHLKFGPNFSRSKYCDIKLTTKDCSGGGFISAHRAILAAVSKKLEKIFDDNLNSVETIVIKNVDFDVLDKIISYVYSGYATFAGDEVEYEDFCDGMATLKIDVGDEFKTSPVADEQLVDEIEVKTEPLEEDLETRNSVVKAPVNLSTLEKSPKATLSQSAPVESTAPTFFVGSFHTVISEVSFESPYIFPESSDAGRVNSEKQSTSNVCDINDNVVSSVLIRSDIFKTKQETFDTEYAAEEEDVEIMEVKEVVEVFLQELPNVSESQIRSYFSSFGKVKDVDLMESVYGHNSGLAVVKIVVDEKSKKEISKLQVEGCHFKLLFESDILRDPHERLDRRFGDNFKKLRLSGIGSGVTRYDLINVIGRDNIQEVFIDGDEGYIQFDKLSFAKAVLNFEFIALNDDKVKVYRSWRDSSRFKMTSEGSRSRNGYSRRSSRRRSRSRSRSKTRSRKRKYSR